MTRKKKQKLERDVTNPDTIKANMNQIKRGDPCSTKAIGDIIRNSWKYQKERMYISR
jgi:hypothetical protein